ncbi:uncharacterized protein FOMMEDRAFT_141951 [Fomitiporia mediterranea MF3/22]|uniref:uncharacterized protein n=1 Tax=Fomitiporia mediterranea (strain MF3/22) TaxID=694068 RepID=UPI0004407D11|nr:uncharacterized protein FOMMEDRAFT_141951 [Fomitiporia mediterranea MF3/22]EJD01282.1 hypothetical protein FOMMEDRAFT_141951 [Fomitiporia mediterranea MF3/22]
MPSPLNPAAGQSSDNSLHSKHSATAHPTDAAADRDRQSDAKNGSATKLQQQNNPPARPPLRSNFELEPNPFEQSFSASSSSLSSLRHSANQRNGGDPSPSSSRNKSPTGGSSSTNGSSNSRKNSLSNASHPNSDTPKPILPPLASITSPSDPSYAWAFSSASLTNSLRAGPLSPAMLAGPQTQQPTTTSQSASSIAALAASAGSMHPPLFAFDPSGSFRTGLTPSTGLTPLVGGPVAFPPPSPNTAAFLAMVNSGSAGSAAAATITPNTLSALTSVLQQSSATASQTGQQAAGGTSNNTNNAGAQQSSSQSQVVVPTSVAPSQVAAPASSAYQSSPLASQSRTNNGSSGNSNNYPDATGAANHAANGLFLLSQAHQELTKREEAQKQSLAQANGAAAKGSVSQSQTVQSTTNGANNAKRGTKRKSDNASISSAASTKTSSSKKSKSSPTSTRAPAARRGSTVSNPDGEDEGGLDEDEESEDEQQQLPPPSSGNNKNKKPETEEEKRKNFLERNRQAALKCRQRKKQWLAQLQAKNEFLQNENERLTAALVASREEISRLSQLVGGAGVGLPSGVVPMVGVTGMGVQQQQVHHAPYMTHQQQHHPIAVPVSLPQGSASINATATSPSMATKPSPHMQQHHQVHQVHHSPNPHSPASDGRSSRSSLRDVRDYANGAVVTTRDNGAREYARDMRERELGHVHGHAPQAVAVNGRGYGY